ncbi:hypothetical protein D5086_001533 [Populus alba]|uniref:Uncharacterized protein n=1 Tax=Populus alba TaxID=43335 RepID=A0ACC4CZF2_POPAL
MCQNLQKRDNFCFLGNISTCVLVDTIMEIYVHLDKSPNYSTPCASKQWLVMCQIRCRVVEAGLYVRPPRTSSDSFSDGMMVVGKGGESFFFVRACQWTISWILGPQIWSFHDLIGISSSILLVSLP